MNTSEHIAEIAKALAAAQGHLVNPEKTKTARVKSDKGSYEYSYASLADGLEGVRKTLAGHDLSFVQVTQLDGDVMTLATRLMHGGSGQWIEGIYPVCKTGAHQQMGAALTYARRYALFAMVGIAGEDDTDGMGAAEGAGMRKSNGAARPAPPPTIPQEQSPEELRAFMLKCIDGMTDIEKLNAWAKRVAPSFTRLSAEGQAFVKAAADRKRGMLTQAPAHDSETGEIIDGDADQKWLTELDDAMTAATDVDALKRAWNEKAFPQAASVTADEWWKAELLYQKHEARLGL